MKKVHRYITYMCSSAALILLMIMGIACSRVEDEMMNAAEEVSLKASLSPVLSSTYTKGVGEIRSDYAGQLNIGLAKVYGNLGDFDDAVDYYGAVMSTADSYGLRDIEFNEFQGFPDASTVVNYVGWYPFEGSVYENPETGQTAVTISVPSDASTDILYSDVSSGTRSSGFNTLIFRHALAKYSIKAYAMDDDTETLMEDVWGEIQTIELEQMPSSCVLTLPSSSNALPEVSTEGSQTLTRPVDMPDVPVGFSNAELLTYFLAPPPSDNILRIRVTTVKDGQTITKKQTLSIARDFQKGKHYQIYLRFSSHGIINSELTVEDWNTGESLVVESNQGVFYDLSESHNANSYIVSAAYNYCFDATVKGNGYTGVIGIPGAQTDLYKIDGSATAEVVWTDIVSEVDNLDDYFTLNPNVVQGRVFFGVKPKPDTESTLNREGNVLIGVRNASGDMLWTWHIWITDRPNDQGYRNGFTMQDRDMGATTYNAVAEPDGIEGLYYQWGRPTPLPLGKTVYRPVYNEDGIWVSNETVEFTSSSDSVSVINRTASPLTYYTVPATAADGTLTKSLWGWKTDTDEYSKTIYDPCPGGYRMPSIRLWRDLSIVDTDVVKAGGAPIAATFKVDANQINVYYPMTGYYTDLDTHVGDGSGAYMWAATFYVGEVDNAEDDRPYTLDFTYEGSVLNEMQTRTERSNYAMPIRCVSRMSKAHVTDLSDYQTANSYIISKEGYYKFNATTRGNGVGRLISPGESTNVILTEQLASVDISSSLVKVTPLWWQTYDEDAPTSDELNQGVHFSFLNDGKPDASGYVSFNVDTFHRGNMILAGRDAKGEIIWTWHLWFTDSPQMMKSNSFVVMDRNLGATYAPIGTTPPTGNDIQETYGLYYQWGRKDPFVGDQNSYIYLYNDGTYTQSQVSAAFKTNDAIKDKTVEHSVSNPMNFQLASEATGGVFTDTDFFSGFDVTSNDNATENQIFSTMVRPYERRSLWGYSATSGYGVTTSKTMYDPCPPGYIVSHYLVWTNTLRNSSSSFLYYTSLDGGWIYHNIGGDYGIFTTKYDDLFDPVWYPFAGYVDGATRELKNVGKMGVFHTSTPAGQGSRSIGYNSNTSGQFVDGDYWGLPSSFAYPVRCQKE